MTIGMPSAPRFVAATEPRKSDTDTAIVRLYPSGASPGGTLVLRVGDVDQDDESWFNSVESLFFGDTPRYSKREVGTAMVRGQGRIMLRLSSSSKYAYRLASGARRIA